MRPWTSEEHVAGYVHVDDQELIKIFYLSEAGLDSNFTQQSSLALAETLNDHAGVSEVGNS